MVKKAKKQIPKTTGLVNDKKIALIAGALDFPKEVAASLRKQGYEVFVIGLKNFVDKDFKTDMEVRLGAAGAAAKAMKQRGIKTIVMAGAIGHPNLSDIRPDWWSVKIVAKVLLNDRGYGTMFDALLGEIEKKGFKIVGAQDVCKDLILPKGTATKTKPNAQDKKDIKRAVELSHIIGKAEIGQAVVVDKLVLGVEGADGTNALLKRCGEIKKESRNMHSGVMAKMKKPQQDTRVDLPVIGMGTLKSVKEANLKGIVVDAGNCFIAQRKETLAYADKHNIFIEAV